MAAELKMECTLARDYAMVDVPDALAYLLIKAVPSSAIQLGSMPLNIGLVIDVSRSMKGKKLQAALEASKLLVNSLREEDWISLVTFSGGANIVVPATPAVDKAPILAVIDEIGVIGATRMFYGMQASADEMCRAGTADKISRMILLTDGETEGEAQCRLNAAQEKEHSIVISALGIGKRYNENLLSDIADATLGVFSHLREPEQINDIFQNELSTAAASVITDVTLQLGLAEGVRLESLDRVYPNSVNLQPEAGGPGNILRAGLGSLMKDEPTIIGAQLRLPTQAAGRQKIADVVFNYSIPSLQITRGEEKQGIFIEYTADPERCGQVNREVISYFNQINAQNLIKEAIHQTQVGNIDEATQSLSQARAITEKLGNLPLTTDIKEALDELEKKGVISAEGVKTIKAGSRRTVRVNEGELK